MQTAGAMFHLDGLGLGLHHLRELLPRLPLRRRVAACGDAGHEGLDARTAAGLVHQVDRLRQLATSSHALWPLLGQRRFKCCTSEAHLVAKVKMLAAVW